jgi:hypothetical protein
MQKIAPEFLCQTHIIKPGDRFHRLIALMTDTYYDDLTDARIEALEAQVESFRWCNANGDRLDQ